MSALTTTSTPAPLGVPHQVQAAWDSDRQVGEHVHLEAVRDLLRRQKEVEDPQDVERAARTVRITLDDRGATAQMLYPDGTLGVEMLLTRHALRQLCSRVLPSRGLGFLDQLLGGAAGDERNHAAALASANLAMFSLRTRDPLYWRTINRRGRKIRAVLSQSYQVYDNLQLVDDVLDVLGRDADRYGVVSYTIDDDAMRIRLTPDIQAYRDAGVGDPTSIIDLWDGEVGNTAVYARGGTWTKWCANGCGHWSNHSKWRWNHSGRTQERIRNGMRNAIESCQIDANQIVEAHAEAQSIQVDNVLAWLNAQTEAGPTELTMAQREQVKDCMESEPTVQAHKGMLTEVIDAVTYVAHEQARALDQLQMERVAGQLLAEGLNTAQDRRIRVRR